MTLATVTTIAANNSVVSSWPISSGWARRRTSSSTPRSHFPRDDQTSALLGRFSGFGPCQEFAIGIFAHQNQELAGLSSEGNSSAATFGL